MSWRRSGRGVQLACWLALCLASSRCGAPAPAPQRGSAAGGGATPLTFGSAGTAASAPGHCTVGSSACYCPDGQLSGTQVCDARQELGACQCAVTSTNPSTTAMGAPSRVCAQLAGMASCAAQSYVSPQLPASVLFVIDRSGSMACNAPPVQTVESCNTDPKRLDPNQPSRWEITSSALDATFGSLTGTAAAVGISMFSTDGYCGVDSTPVVGVDLVDTRQLSALSDALHKATPAGGTPIVGSVISAYHHLHEELHAAGNRYVVLITDGEESCGTHGNAMDTADLAAARTRLLETEVQNARTANIKTFVVGTPGSEGARGFLSELAFRGGTGRSASCTHGDPTAATGDCHYDLTTEKDFAAVLRSTLGKISSEARGCDFQAPGSGGDSLNVQLSSPSTAPNCLPLDNRDCSTAANGFQYAKHSDGTIDYTRVTLCGPACDLVKSDPTVVVDVILGCSVLQ